MFRSSIAVGLVLFGAVIGSPIVRAQEPPKADPTTQKPAARTTVEVGSQRKFVFRRDVVEAQDPTKTVSRPVDPSRIYQVHKTLDPLLHNFGLSLVDADDALRAQLEIPPGEGVVVMTIKPESLADQAGLKPKDVILSLRDTPARNVAEVKNVLLSLTQEAIPLKLIREGKPRQLSVVGPKHGIPAEPTEYWIGVGVTPVDSTLRSHLPALVEDSGLIANSVVKDSAGEASGLKQNDILVSLDGKPLKTREAMIAIIQTSEGKPMALNILRAGKPLTLKISPAKRPANIGFTTFSVDPVQIQQSYIANLPQLDGLPYLATLQVEVKTDDKAEPQGAASKPIEIRQGPTRIEVFGPNQARPSPDNPAARSREITIDGNSEPIHLEFVGKANPQQPDAKTARLESQIKDLSTKLDEIKTILEGLKKPDAK